MARTRPIRTGRIFILLWVLSLVIGTGVVSAQEPSVAMTVTKTATPAVIHAGDEVTYDITVTNTGTWPLSLEVIDDVLGTIATGYVLDNGAAQTFTVTKAIFEDVTNTVTVTGNPIGADNIDIVPVVETASATVDVLNPAITVTKTASVDTAMPGDVVEYTIEVTNTGDTQLSVDIDDTVFGTLGTDLSLDLGEVGVLTTEHQVYADVTNTVTVTGTDAIGGTVVASTTATVAVGEAPGGLSIVEGPTVAETAPDYAIIEWITNEPSDGLVRFDARAGVLGFEAADAALVTHHALTLDGLVPATTYHFVVRSTDSVGNTASSADLTFATPAWPDTQAPEVSLISPLRWEGITPVLTDASDTSGIERVEFFVDGVFVFTDYSSPFRIDLDSQRYGNGSHQVTTRAFDVAGNSSDDTATVGVANLTDASTPVVKIISPAQNAQVSGKIQVKVSLSDDVGLFKGTLRVDGQWFGDWYPDPGKAVTSLTIDYPWDTRLTENGGHRVAFEIYDTDLKYAVGFVDVVVANTPPPPPPKLVVSRSVVRHNNYFTVDLTVKNVGGDTATKVRLRDTLQLFQPISRTTATVDYSASYKPELTSWYMDIDDSASLGKGKQRTYRYDVVPVLLNPGSSTPKIGGDKYSPPTGLTITWYEDLNGQNYYVEHHLLYSPSQTGSTYADALKSADYLIVTSPANLFRLNPTSDTNSLLSSMAHLARLKNGVLGYLDVPASFPRDYEAHDGFAIGDVREDARAEVIIGDASNDRVVVANIPTHPTVSSTVSYEVKWFEQTPFKIGYRSEGFDPGDGLTAGNVFGGLKDHVIMSDASADFILPYDGSGFPQGTFYINTGGFSGLDIDTYDGLTAGNVVTGARDELIFADRSANEIYVLRFLSPYPKDPPLGISRPLTKITKFSTDYEAHDGLAAGDVTGGALDEIVLADRSGNKVFIFSGAGNLLGFFNRDFEEGDGLAVANVVSTYPDKAEIVISDRSADRVYAYSANGTLLASVARDVEGFDGLAAGPITRGTIAEVVVADRSLDYLDFYDLARPTADKYVLRNLIKADYSLDIFTGGVVTAAGSWSTKLADDWVTDGYLLIVGESDIVPTWGNRTFGSVLTTHGDKTLIAHVTDYPYASTYGKEITPELAIGRVIGNTAAELRKPIEASIGVTLGTAGTAYDRSHALAVSGYSAGLGGGSDSINFKAEALKAALTLKNSSVDPIFMETPAYTQYKPDGSIDVKATGSKIVSKFFANTPSKDVIFLSGHGSGNGWDEIGSWDVLAQTDPFSATNPFVFASSCNTGQFFNAYSLANAFLSQGAGAYLGATTWGLGSHAWISNYLFGKWDPGESVGEVVKEVKRSIGFMTLPAPMFGDGSAAVAPKLKEQYWSAIYHVFGDPKFGSEGPPAPAPASTAAASSAPDQVTIEVPGYEVIEDEGTQTIFVPGGGMAAVSGYPPVPYYTSLRDIPAGYEVQDVTMTERSDPVIDTGFNIPPAVEAIGASEGDPSDASSLETEPGWWPNVPFSWAVIDGPDGDQLAITVFPVDYDRTTTDLRFYSTYRFDMAMSPSPTEIQAVTIDSHVFGLDPVTGEVRFGDGRHGEAPPDGHDVVMRTVVRRASTGELVAGLPLRTLTGVRSAGAFSVTWDPEGADPGAYMIEVELWDTNGTLIDRRTSTVVVEESISTVAGCGGLPATIVGTEGDDVLWGTEGDDVIVGLGGDDLIYGLGGNDLICGGAGDDHLEGGLGDDALYGGTGDDDLNPGLGEDSSNGGAGLDLASLDGDRTGVTADLAIGIADSPGGIHATLVGIENMTGGSGPDVLYGDDGPNILNGAAGHDQLYGLGGDDKLIGSAGNDALYGGAGDDRVLAGAGDDLIEGGPGDDQLQGMNGKDVIYGEAGDDVLDGGPSNDVLDGGDGSDTIEGGPGRDRCDGELKRRCELGSS